MTPLTPAAVTALAQQAAESPAHLDPTLVQQVCQEWETMRETIGCGEAVLQAYDMTPKGLTEMADWLASETNGEPECQEAEIVAALRSTAVAFVAHEGWLALAVADRARDRAALAAARAALEAVEWVGAGSLPSYCPWCDGHDPADIPTAGREGHAPDCQRQAAVGLAGETTR